MQAYVEPTLSGEQGRAHWRAMLDEVDRERLMAPFHGAVLLRFCVLFPFSSSRSA